MRGAGTERVEHREAASKSAAGRGRGQVKPCLEHWVLLVQIA